MSKTILRVFIVFVLAVGLFSVVAQTTARSTGALSQLKMLVDVRQELVSIFVEEPDEQEMTQAAVRAMVDSLEDPYTVYLTMEDIEGFGKEIRGTFSGIGAEVESHEKRVRIVTPLDDSPAWRSGILPGDVILEIDGEDTYEMSLNDAVDRLTGEAGTDVVVLVRHDTGVEETITITRAVIKIQTVKGLFKNEILQHDYMLDPVNKVGYIRLTKFSDLTRDHLVEALNQLKSQDVQGIIIDVRFNPGGLLQSAVELSDMFLEGDKRIVSTKGRVEPEHVFNSTDQVLMPDIPLVMLANGYSASASEIMTGALLDNGRAKFIGTRTFGKGSAQQIRQLSDGNGAIKITTSYWYLPSGRNIHRRENSDQWGVDPEEGYYVIMTPDQRKDMVETRREHELNGALRPDPDTTPVNPEWIKEQLDDPQLAAALTAMLDRLQTGEWHPVGNGSADQLVLEEKRQNLLALRTTLLNKVDDIDKEIAELDAEEQADGEQFVVDKANATEVIEITPETKQQLKEEQSAEPVTVP